MKRPVVALLYPGDRSARDRGEPAESRFKPLFEAFDEAGATAVPAIYNDAFADEVEAQLRGVDAVLVWCNPIQDGNRRDRLDTLLRAIDQRGIFVSTHPETILRLGTKDVLLDVKELPFGSDVVRVDSIDQLQDELPDRLISGPRVLKQHRGHSGIGVWRVERIAGSPRLRVRHAQRGSQEEQIDMRALRERLAPYFEAENGGHMVDQPWQPRLVEGMLRAYLVRDRVVGFGFQAVNALYTDPSGRPPPAPGPRHYHSADYAPAQALRGLLETGWIEALCRATGVVDDRLPMLWDCDFMPGERTCGKPERYVLCEVNVSSVSPFPPSAIQPLVACVIRRLWPCI